MLFLMLRCTGPKAGLTIPIRTISLIGRNGDEPLPPHCAIGADQLPLGISRSMRRADRTLGHFRVAVLSPFIPRQKRSRAAASIGHSPISPGLCAAERAGSIPKPLCLTWITLAWRIRTDSEYWC